MMARGFAGQAIVGGAERMQQRKPPAKFVSQRPAKEKHRKTFEVFLLMCYQGTVVWYIYARVKIIFLFSLHFHSAPTFLPSRFLTPSLRLLNKNLKPKRCLDPSLPHNSALAEPARIRKPFYNRAAALSISQHNPDPTS
jgi:hypothetical protein